MATHRIPILGWHTAPDTVGEVFFEPFPIKATNDVWDHLVCVFNQSSTRDGLHGAFTVPENYVGTANVVIVWSTAATTGDVEWDFDYRTTATGDQSTTPPILDKTGTEQTVNANDTVTNTAATDWDRHEISIALTDGNFAGGDFVQFTLFRDQVDAGDTISVAVVLFELYFEYADA